MPKNGLETARRARKVAVDAALRDLAQALAEEQRAAAAEAAATTALRRETDAATATTSSDAAVEAFAAWLPHGLAEQSRVRHSLAQAAGVTSTARAALAAAKVAEASVDSLLEKEALARKGSEERRAQAGLDEMAADRTRRIRGSAGVDQS